MTDQPDSDPNLPSCSVVDCARPVAVFKAGLCAGHYHRLWADGETGTAPLRGGPHAARRRRKLACLTYPGALSRLRQTRGPASAHPCARCGGQVAAGWRLVDPARPGLACSDAGHPYSCDPEDYHALCRPCIAVVSNPDPDQPALWT